MPNLLGSLERDTIGAFRVFDLQAWRSHQSTIWGLSPTSISPTSSSTAVVAVVGEELGTQPERRKVVYSHTFAFWRLLRTQSAQHNPSPKHALEDCLSHGFLFKKWVLHTEMCSATT